MVKATECLKVNFCNGNKLEMRVIKDSITFMRNYVLVESIADDATEVRPDDLHKYEIYVSNVDYFEHHSDYKAVRVIE